MNKIFFSLNFFVPFALLSVLCVHSLRTQRIECKHHSYKSLKTDTVKIIPDDYPVTDEIFGSDFNQNGREIKSGDIFSYDKIWFRNDSLNQTLVFELYTDNYRNIIFH